MSYVPWPAECPEERILQYWPYSLQMATEGFAMLLPRDAQLYVEVGTYCGASALVAAQIAPEARIICIDTWDGRASDCYDTQWKDRLLPICQANLWEIRSRVDLLQDTSQAGLIRVYCAGMKPDLIYIDADHHYEAVKADMKLARQLFPEAQVCGDDFSEPDVSKAVSEVLEHDFGVLGCSFWWEVRPKATYLLSRFPTSNLELQEKYSGFKPRGLEAYTAVEVRGADTGAGVGEVQ